MVIQARCAPYGRAAAEALRAEIAAAKGDEPLAPVTVIVPSNQVGVSARRLLASGAVGSVCGSGVGLVAVSFLTAYRLAELLGAANLAGTDRRPISTPVLTAAVRASLKADAGLFQPVAAHFATEAALVGAYRELRDPSSATLDALASRGERAADVIRLHRATRARLVAEWYDEEDLMTVAVEAVSSREAADVKRTIGAVIVYLPQRLSRHAATLLTELATKTNVAVVAGITGDARADAEVMTSARRLGVALVPDASAPVPITSVERTRFFTASDADEEVREAVRAVVNAARGGTPLDRIAILHASPEPYDRLIREHLSAAGISENGATEIPVAARLAGRTLLQLLDLPSLRFRREDVFAWLTAAPVLAGRHRAPVTAWERISREAGVVAGSDQWDGRLRAFAEQLEAKAAVALEDVEQPQWQSEKLLDDAERARGLRSFVLELIDTLQAAAAEPRPWSDRATWAQKLLVALLGGSSSRRDAWPSVERKAAERVELALDRLAILDSVEEAVDLDVFARTLAIELESDLGRVGRFGEGVFVGSVGMGVGLDLDLVILLGLAEGSFPASVHDDSLLPDSEREAAQGEFALRSQRVDREHREFLVALAGSAAHVLGIPRGDLRRSSERVASRWALEVASSLAGRRWWSPDLLEATVPWVTHLASFDEGIRRVSFPATEQEHRLRGLLAAAAQPADLAALTAATDPLTSSGVRVLDARRSSVFTRFDGNLAGLPIPSPVDTGASATSLERWAKCPRAYLMQNLLKVEEIENPEEELMITAPDKGSLVHEILEKFFEDVLGRPSAEQPAPDQPWTIADRARMQAIAEECFVPYVDSGLAGRPIFWGRDQNSILRDLDQFLAHDERYRAATGARPAAVELAFGMRRGSEAVHFPLPDGRTLLFRGKADRVDVTTSGLIYVLDYKTGKSKKYRKLSEDTPDQRGRRLQLAVYAQAARLHRQQPDAEVEARYWFVSAAGNFEQLGYHVTPEVIGRVSETVGTIVEGIEHGVFAAHPGPLKTGPFVDCVFCDPDGLGTGELRRQWERKTTDQDLAAYVALVDPLSDDESAADVAQP